MDTSLLDLYTDYLLSSFGKTTATGLARLMGAGFSHDTITRFLSKQDFTSADLWQVVKPLVRKTQTEQAVLIIDDSIMEKPHTDENELVCWHYDHTKGQNVKGVNFLTTLYHVPASSQTGPSQTGPSQTGPSQTGPSQTGPSQTGPSQTGPPTASQAEVALPVAFALVTKPDIVLDPKSGKPKRQSRISKNEQYRQMLRACQNNQLLFAYVLNDAWFASAENMTFVKETLHKDFVMPLKKNRKVALSQNDKQEHRFCSVETLPLEAGVCQEVWLDEVAFPLQVVKLVFASDDPSSNDPSAAGALYLVTSDLTLDGGAVLSLYQKRWQVEEYHKSLKQNACLAASPTRTPRTQSNHLFCAVCAYVKLETLKLKTQVGHFALKGRLYLAALQSAFAQFRTHQRHDPSYCCVTSHINISLTPLSPTRNE